MTTKQGKKPGKKLAIKKQTVKDLPASPSKTKQVRGGHPGQIGQSDRWQSCPGYCP